jgi:hypothetical protein
VIKRDLPPRTRAICSAVLPRWAAHLGAQASIGFQIWPTIARRKFFNLARLQKAPIAIEAVERIDALFAIEREINAMVPPERFAVGALPPSIP